MTSTNRLARACRVGLLLLPGLLSAGLVGGCGKKGPPLAPLVAMPARIADPAPRRLGDSVRIRFTVPDTNLDGTRPANLDRIEVYAFTGLLPTDISEVKEATLLGSVQVQRFVTAEQQEKWEKQGVAPPPNPGVPAGAAATVTEVLTAEALIPVVPKKPKKVLVAPVEPVQVFRPLVGPVPEVRPQRFYFARGVSRKNVKGPLSIRPALALEAPPTQPVDAGVEFSEQAVTVTWLPPAEQRKPIQEPAEGEILPATPKGVATTVVFTYNVYLVADPAAPETPPAPVAAEMHGVPVAPVDPLQPLNAAPLAGLTFADTTFELGKPRCYVVRAVDQGVESEPTPPVCVTPVDVFPPPAPTALAAIGSEGAISLIWEGVESPDLAGYVVMRGEGADAPLLPLFEQAIREASYRDATAKPGVRYTYAVVSIDTATPRNVSLPSNRAEEAAR